MKRLPAIVLAAAAMLAVACSKTPSGVIPPDKMARLVADINVGNAVVETETRDWGNDSLRLALKQSIYARHGVTTEEVDSSLVWYGHNIEVYMDVLDEAEEILQQRISDAEQAGGKSTSAPRPASLDGDSVNLWAGVNVKRNTAADATEFMPFTLFTDRNWDRGDRYTLAVRGVNTRSPLTLVMAADYNDGTTEYVSLSRNSEETQRLLLVLDSAKVATRVYGSIRYVATGDEVSYLDSISLVRTRGRNDNVRARRGQHVTRNR